MKHKSNNGMFHNHEGVGITKRTMTLNMGQLYSLNMFIKSNEELGKSQPEKALDNVLTVLKNIVGADVIKSSSIEELTNHSDDGKSWMIIRKGVLWYKAIDQADAEFNCTADDSTIVFDYPSKYV